MLLYFLNQSGINKKLACSILNYFLNKIKENVNKKKTNSVCK